MTGASPKSLCEALQRTVSAEEWPAEGYGEKFV